MTDLVNKLAVNNSLSKGELEELLKFRNKETADYLFEKALMAKEKLYGKKIYVRGIVELTNYCKNNCYYCGLRRDNIFIQRYRLDEKGFNSVKKDMAKVSGLLCLLGEMTIISRKAGSQIWLPC